MQLCRINCRIKAPFRAQTVFFLQNKFNNKNATLQNKTQSLRDAGGGGDRKGAALSPPA